MGDEEEEKEHQTQLVDPDAPSLPHPTRSLSTYGRVVYLHFVCRAPLPVGSYLRVTSSQLWAPGNLFPTDPTDAKNISVKANELALPDNTVDGMVDAGDGDIAFGTTLQHSYASSVEMVTSPDEWPIWRTRTPVVIALRHHHGRTEHHRYRYLVVTPGAESHQVRQYDEFKEDTNDEEEIMMIDTAADQQEGTRKLGTTSSQTESSLASNIVAWEDPFKDSNSIYENHGMSAVSLPSVRRQALSKTLSNLPYRTIEIDTHTATVRNNRTFPSYDGSSEQESKQTIEGLHDVKYMDSEFTADGIQIDTWNRGDDLSFCPYILRNELNKQNRNKRDFFKRINSSTATVVSPNDDKEGICIDENGASIRSRVSFNHMIEVVPATEISNDGDQLMDSTITSLTMTPKLSKMSFSSKSSLSKQKKNRIFFVCFHLPVILRRDKNTNQWRACWSESLLAATEGSKVVSEFDCHWIGTVSSDINSEDEKEQVRAVLAEMNCTPLFLEKKIQDDHYYGMCKQVLWPAFHNIDLLDLSANVTTNDLKPIELEGMYRVSDWDQSRLDGWWEAYKAVNTVFAEALSALLQPGDIMWVHDYHLSLLPKLVDNKERLVNDGQCKTKKVFLLHIPFPTSQVFRELECGEDILDGMLHADLVGFHAFDHARHFLKASKRIFGLNYESLIGGLIGIQLRTRTVLVTMHNVSIEPLMVDAALAMSTVIEGATVLRSRHSSRKIIAGIDVAQRLSGIALKLLAFERLLKDYPVWQQNVILIQKCLIPQSRHEDEARTLQEVRYLVKRIKDKFGPNVIDYEEIMGSSLPIDQRLSLWKVADVFMSTPIREGLNLLPLEYVFAKKKPSAPGVVITSEFSAVSSVLNGALRVNPYDIQMAVTNIDKALTMNFDEKEGRRVRDEGFVSSCTSSQWTKHVLDDLYDATAVIYGSGNDSESDDTSMMGTKYEKQDMITSTATFLAQEHEIGFCHLDMNAVTLAYKATRRRVLLLDLNGTIIFKEPPGKYLKRDILGSSGVTVEPAVTSALTALCADPKNTVFVVSGDSQENVERAIGHIPGLGLAASNGACFAPPRKNGHSNWKWKYFDLGVDWEAVKSIVMPILAKYTARSNGSFIKLTHSSIGWSYYSCDPEWGSTQAAHLVLELEQVLRVFDVRFVMIKGIVEVVPRMLNKGLIVKNVLREAQLKGEVDFILCMGDDIQDEKMFTSVSTFLAELKDPDHIQPVPPVVDENGDVISSVASMSERSHHGLQHALSCDHSDNSNEAESSTPIYAFTATVGKKESHALQYVDDANDVATLLCKFVDSS